MVNSMNDQHIILDEILDDCNLSKFPEGHYKAYPKLAELIHYKLEQKYSNDFVKYFGEYMAWRTKMPTRR